MSRRFGFRPELFLRLRFGALYCRGKIAHTDADKYLPRPALNYELAQQAGRTFEFWRS
jgi:hypothetical protein